jgi:hypothetical protein
MKLSEAIRIAPFDGAMDISASRATIEGFQSHTLGKWQEPGISFHSELYRTPDEGNTWLSALGLVTDKLMKWEQSNENRD